MYKDTLENNIWFIWDFQDIEGKRMKEEQRVTCYPVGMDDWAISKAILQTGMLFRAKKRGISADMKWYGT